MAVADMGKAPTAVRNPKNQKSRDITTFEEGPTTRERNRHCGSAQGCFGGRGPSDIYLWWVLWFFAYAKERN